MKKSFLTLTVAIAIAGIFSRPANAHPEHELSC